MTANEDALDLDAIETAMRYDSDWLHRHGRSTARRLIAEIRSARASIGPDEVAVPVSRAAIGHLARFGCAHGDRAGCSPGNCWALKSIALAALSQPHPAQEQQ